MNTPETCSKECATTLFDLALPGRVMQDTWFALTTLISYSCTTALEPNPKLDDVSQQRTANNRAHRKHFAMRGNDSTAGPALIVGDEGVDGGPMVGVAPLVHHGIV